MNQQSILLYLAIASSLTFAISTRATQVELPLGPPAEPDQVQVTAAGTDNWLLRWTDEAADEAGFIIERNDGSWTQIGSVGPNVQVLLVPGDTSASSPEFRVKAFNAAGESAYAGPASASAGEAMNIIFLLADDMGYKDIVALRDEATDGPTIHETPALDALINQGVNFTNAFASGPRCVVARRALQTGQYDFRPGVIGSGGGIDPSEITVGEALKANGYRTCFIGKWHLGSQADNKAPEDQGYDVSIAAGEFGAPNNSYFPDAGTLSYNLPNLGPAASPDEYLTDRLTTEARGFIVDHVANHSGQPFFMILSHYAVHTPLEAKPADIDYFTAKRATTDFSTHPVQQAMIEDYTADVRIWQENILYAAMMKSYDDSLAGLRAELDLQGIADKTIIVVSSDHGGKNTFDADSNKALEDFPTSNYPFRLGKTWCYDGGLRIPLIVYWPGVTGAGEETEAFVHGADFYTTFLDMGSAPAVPAQHIDSISFLPAALDPVQTPRTETHHYFYGISDGTGSTTLGAYRKDRYKLVYHLHQRFAELFDVVSDPGEQIDLVDAMPTLANEMLTEFLQIRKETDAKLLNPTMTNWSTEVSNLQSYMTIPPAPAAAPGSVTATPIARSAVDLAWTDNSTNETCFIVFRKGPGESYYNEHKVLPANTTAWRDTGLQTSGFYNYYIVAHNMGGWKTSSTISTTTLAIGSPLGLNPEDDTVRIRASELRGIAVLLNDEGEGLTIESVSTSSLGITSISGDHVVYHPKPGHLGSETLTYTARDEFGNTATASINLTIQQEPGISSWESRGLLGGAVGAAPAGDVLDRFDGVLEWTVMDGALLDGSPDVLPFQAQYRNDDYSLEARIDSVSTGVEAGLHLRESLDPFSRALSVTTEAGGIVRIRNRATSGSPALEDEYEWSGIVAGASAVLKIERTGELLRIFISNDEANEQLLAQTTWASLDGHFIGLTAFSPAVTGHAGIGKLEFRTGVGFLDDPLRLPDAVFGIAYQQDLIDYLSQGGVPPFTFLKLSGPAWVDIDGEGLLTGLPPETGLGPNSVNVSVTDSVGGIAFTTFDLALRTIGGGGGLEDFTASEDTFASESNPTTNYATRDPVQVRDPDPVPDNTFGRYSYFKYVVSGLSETPDTVELHLFVEGLAGYSGNFEVFLVPDNGWTDTAVTWDARPVLGTFVGSFPAAEGQWTVIDVSSFVSGNGTFSFAVTEDTNNRADITAIGSANETFLRFSFGPLNNFPVEDSPPPASALAKSNTLWTIDLAPYFSDPDGDALIFSKVSGPAWVSVFSDGFIRGTPSTSDFGSEALTVRIEDPYGAFIEHEIALSTGLSSVDAWVDLNGLTGLDSYLHADADLDGRLNFLEFWEDTNPTVPDLSPYPVSLSIQPNGGSIDLDFKHQVRIESDGFSIRFYGSDDLAAWDEIFPTGNSNSAIGGDLLWSTQTFSGIFAERLFIRRGLEFAR